jgi:RNA polymerase sigma-70 factor (ECF subfamily)
MSIRDEKDWVASHPRGTQLDISAIPESDLSSSSLEASTILLQRAQRGDFEARDRIFARYYPRLLRWASGRLPPHARALLDTCDLIQETVLKAIRGLSSLEIPPHGGLLPYLRTAVRNLIRDQVRQAARRGGHAPLNEDFAEDPRPSPLEQTMGKSVLDRYEAALERLRPEEQQAILLRVELDCSWGLIAKETGKPSADAARMATSRALLRLAEEMSRADEPA